MHASRLLLLVATVAATAGLTACGTAGQSLAGGQGDPSLYDVVPPVPSTPVQLGEYLVRLNGYTTEPTGYIDENVAVKDTATFQLTSPANEVIGLSGVFLNPTINDLIYLRDKGQEHWTGESQAAGASFTLITDVTGNPQQLLITATSTATVGGTILSQRTYDFGYPIGNPPGLYNALCEDADTPDWVLNPGDWENLVLRGDGIAQWEWDVGTSIQRYWVRPDLNLESQYTAIFSADSPDDLSEWDLIVNVLLISSGERVEGNNAVLGDPEYKTYEWAPPPGGIYPINTAGTWSGTVSNVEGSYTGRPYDLTNGQSVSFTIDDATVQMLLTEGFSTYTEDIIALTGGTADIYNQAGGTSDPFAMSDGVSSQWGQDDLVAVRALGDSGYELVDLQRDTAPSDLVVTGANAQLVVSQYEYTLTGAELVGQYTVFPLTLTP